MPPRGEHNSVRIATKPGGGRCRVAGAGHYMIGSNRVPGVPPPSL